MFVVGSRRGKKSFEKGAIPHLSNLSKVDPETMFLDLKRTAGTGS